MLLRHLTLTLATSAESPMLQQMGGPAAAEGSLCDRVYTLPRSASSAPPRPPRLAARGGVRYDAARAPRGMPTTCTRLLYMLYMYMYLARLGTCM